MHKSTRVLQCMENVDFDQTTRFINELQPTGGYTNLICDTECTADMYFMALKHHFAHLTVKHFTLGAERYAPCNSCIAAGTDDLCELCTKKKQRENSIESIDLNEINLMKKHATDGRTKAVDGQKQLWFMLCPNTKHKNAFTRRLFNTGKVNGFPYQFYLKNCSKILCFT